MTVKLIPILPGLFSELLSLGEEGAQSAPPPHTSREKYLFSCDETWQVLSLTDWVYDVPIMT